MEERFAADRTLGTLVKWLRILGYDTVLNGMDKDRKCFEEAADEGRTVLTRKRDLARLLYQGRLIVVKADRVEEQIVEVLEALRLKPDPTRRMTRCLICNVLLEEVSKEAVDGLVPAYVYENYAQFHRCRRCGKIFWQGTHPRRIEEFLGALRPPHHP